MTINYESLIRKNRSGALSPEKFIKFACIVCEREIDDPRRNRCPDCNGAVDAIYDLDNFVAPETLTTPNTLLRYFSLLPLKERESVHWLGEGNTPCFEVPALAAELGVGRLFFKDESANPTRSTKDRIASVGLSHFTELGVTRLVLSSTGNSSTAYARGAQLVDGFQIHIFVGRDFVHRLNYTDHPAVHTHVVDGPFVAAGGVAQRYARENGIAWEGGFFNLSRREGLKLAYLEAFDAMPVEPTHVFQAISSGMGLLGAYKGALEYRELGRLSRLPSFVAVQQESCGPMAHAFTEGAETIGERHIVKNPRGLAYAILRGDPTPTYPYVRDLVLQSRGGIEAASDLRIREAHRMLAEVAGVRACYASATAFAGAVKMAREGRLGEDSVLLVNLTGTDRPSLPVPTRLTEWSENVA
ncbi:threonine synthase [Sphaerisporangium rufum]|uniref:Threonine synthase n=1 Tax=Sphaerisporangium rufum TaxID=1381558 RepID=A0A919QZH2_9ACTN|nr:pyridoxal-phosphate dependent enzyme [Sphaerisporangium rufum]GII77019.1 threonine synthase [Sphaerisporangium rufum]